MGIQTSDLKSFHYLENEEIMFSNYRTDKTTQVLDSGFYDLSFIDTPVERRVCVKQLKNSETIKIYTFPDRNRLENIFVSFFDQQVVAKVKKLGFYRKLGVLLYGKEGTGKSTIMRYYADLCIERHAAIVFYMSSPYYVDSIWEFIQNIRHIQANPIVIIFDEFEDHIKPSGYNYEAKIKVIIDGNKSIDNCIFLASTNYIDSIPAAIKNRPSRFRDCLHIEGISDIKEICEILSPMLEDMMSAEDITTLATKMQNHTLDEIKQAAMDKIMNIESYKREKKSTIGFNRK